MSGPHDSWPPRERETGDLFLVARSLTVCPAIGMGRALPINFALLEGPPNQQPRAERGDQLDDECAIDGLGRESI
jgi:hypothetical protein